MAQQAGAAGQLSPEEFLEQLAATGMFEGQDEELNELRKLAKRGVHPMQVMMFRRQEETARSPVLESFDLEGIAQHIAEKGCHRIVVMCGAGISTSAGIPDFRSPGTGLYDNLQRFNLPKPEAIFELGFFRENPAAFYELAREMWPGTYEPTPAHYFIKLLDSKGLLLRCYSQNIDSLEQQAGLPAEKLIAAHGNFDGAHVIDTDPEKDVEIGELKTAIEKGEDGWKALKEKYGNLVKPKIVFFGESLPKRFLQKHQEDLIGCDLLIVLGTSLCVQPFASLVGRCASEAPRLLINRDSVGTHDKLDIGFRFNAEKNWRDVFHQDDCDGGCRAFAKALGWGADLEALIESKGSALIEKAPWVSAPNAS
jgi:NAD-dependent deacetylase sirtuin 2|eukprot:TRINITY_DN56592_c0_g1_i1.p1 TRINITY_DN56592_c0_g1~~TRINITY_DN56592_c0_g1_i1.p1  ORF type:complete len:367 (-),score=65.76 TRINITY_DN56592_c0_g1_i1:184-1284(-)